MTFRFAKKEILILVLSLFLMISIIFSGYYLYLSPKKEDVKTKTASLKSEQKLLESLQQKQNATSSLTVENIAVLQRKLPVKEQIEQLILDLEKAEVVSGSLIKNMAFAEADVSGATPENTAQQQQTTEQTKTDSDSTTKDTNTEESKQGTDTEQTDTSKQSTDGSAQQTDTSKQSTDQTSQQNTNQATTTTQYQATPLPTGIKKVTVTLQVESSTYEQLRDFISEVENLPRILVVETVGFTGAGEVTDLATKKSEKLAYTVTLSAFYMPSLTDLVDKLPELVPPKPGNKTNPFNSFPDLSNEDQTE